MTDANQIALNKLVAWKGNVRKTGAKDGISELAASIAAHGLLQSLVVRKIKGGKYEVVAGRRRLLALQSLAKARSIEKNRPVACTIPRDGIDATELSLAENVVRAPMHPADQFDAFRAIIDGGASVTDVAARFGVSEALVTKRLKLGRLSPVILDAYRKAVIDLEEAQAFALTDDHAEQERVFENLPEWNRSADAIRDALTEAEIPATDKRVRFIGLDAYETAGGAVRRDLFDERNGGYVQDASLLTSLVHEKLASFVDDLKAEGWSWVEVTPEFDYQTLSGYVRRYPERQELSDEQQAEFDRLAAEYDALADSDDEADAQRLAEIDSQIEAFAPETWSADTLAIGGAMIGLGNDGMLRIERGLIRKDDARALQRSEKGAVASASTAAMPAKLVADLTAQKSAAISAMLSKRPDIALATVVHALALDTFYLGEESALRLSARDAQAARSMTAPDSCLALHALAEARDRFSNVLPAPEELFAWCLERTRDELLELLAFIAATAVNAVQDRNDHPQSMRLRHAAQLAEALGLDMRTWFVPGAENYFGQIGRADILAAIDEANGSHAPALEKLKKAELAVRAEGLVANTGWLPQPLRSEKAA
jgi:ParB family chromosome partitioning protein